MTETAATVLLVDPDARARALVAQHLGELGCRILEASDAPNALRMIADGGVRVVVTELYLPTTTEDCLVHSVRREKAYRTTRIVAHTHRSLAADREWAMRAGADAYLIKPTRAARVRYVVGRLVTARGSNAAVPATSDGPITRRDSLDMALREVEQGAMRGTSSIVFGREWWEQLTAPERTEFRRRARRARVNLRSDSMLSNHFVEVRGPTRSDTGLATERPESPYRARPS